MEYTEEFTLKGKSFICIDLSGIKTKDDLHKRTQAIMPIIAKHPANSLYTITNIENTRFDTDSKKTMADYMEHNKKYVRSGAVFGLDGIKRIMAQSVLNLIKRTEMHFAFSKEQAIEWLLKQE